MGIVLAGLAIYCFLFLVGIVSVPNFVIDFFQRSDSVSKEVQILHDFPTDIIIYGEDMPFEEGILHRTITHADESTLKKESNYEFSMLVINNRNNDITLSAEEIECIRNYIYEKGNNIVYLGEKYNDVWKMEEEDSELVMQGGYGTAYLHRYGRVTQAIGFWTKDFNQ